MKETLYTGYVYMIYNDVNDKVYIGETLQKITTRFKQHIQKAFDNNRKYDGLLFRAIRKYGKEHFFIKELQAITGLDRNKVKEEIQKLEIDYIKKYDSFNNGYNIDEGGGRGFKLPSEETRLKQSISHKTSKSCLYYQKINIEAAHENNKIPVNMYYIDSPEILESFESIISAAKKYDLDKSHITKICKKKGNYVKINGNKYVFRYANEIYEPEYTVECYTDSLGIIDRFVLSADGAKKYGADPSAVVRCCKGKNNFAGKYNNEPLKWKYIYG